MKLRALGSLQVSEVGLGCNNFGSRLDQAATTSVVHASLDAGVNFFDTADIYGDLKSEVQLGVALGSRRDDAIIATKFGMLHDKSGVCATPQYVRESCDASLQRLGTDVIDLYQLHFPDDSTPLAETIGAMQELVAQGKVREIGCSNLSAAQLHEAARAAGSGPRFVSIQSQYSLLARQPETDGVLQACADLGIGFLPFYPLANGLLTGKVRPGEPIPEGTRLSLMPEDRKVHWLSDRLRSRVDSLLAFGDETGVAMLDFAFSWLLHHPAVASVIAGASNAQQIQANAAAVRELTTAQLQRLDELTAEA
ncbi:MAG: aldo/keto reductase [Acidimicrobiaceae bacterium]|nr:aldo/keto reductase [Acidimicrobiaceae bacterium]